MSILAVDLAERWSAGVLYDPQKNTTVWEQTVDFGEAERPPNPFKHFDLVEGFAGNIISVVRDFGVECVVVENLSHQMVNPVPAIRAQTVLLYVCHRAGIRPELVMASTWQRELGYKKIPGRTTKGWAKALCAGLGYVPFADAKGKSGGDLRDAYLIARWRDGLRFDRE